MNQENIKWFYETVLNWWDKQEVWRNEVNRFAKRYSLLLFLLALSYMSYRYKYHKILFSRPQSIHVWRQADGASFAQNYYQDDMNFFKPQLHHLKADDNTSGYEVSEAPILYYFVAILYKIFGYHEFIFRLVNNLIFFLGLFYLFRLIKEFTDDTFWTIALTLFYFTSPVVVAYANSFLPNSTSLAFVFVGWFYAIRFFKLQKNKQLYIAALFFTLAGLLKIISLMSVFAVIIILSVNYFQNRKQKLQLFTVFQQLAPFLICLAVNFAWYSFVLKYNTQHQSNYFGNYTRPIWSLNFDEIVEMFLFVKELWFGEYFSIYAFILIFSTFVTSLFFAKRMNKTLLSISILLVLSSLSFIMLWYRQFHDHDYYFLDMFIVLVAMILPMLDFLQRNFPKYLKSILIKLAFLIFLIFNLNYASKSLNYRYACDGWMNKYDKNESLGEISPYLRSIGIQHNDKVLSIPDESNCYSLYLMNQKGWTQLFGFYRDSISINKLVNKGAKYLIVNGSDSLNVPYIKSFTRNKVGQYKDVHIFSLGK